MYPEDAKMPEVRDELRGTVGDPRFANTEPTPAPQSEIPHALMRLERANSQLHEVVGVLHERLQPVRHETPRKDGDAGNKAVRDYGSELARVIGDQANRAEMASEVIIKILNELEV